MYVVAAAQARARAADYGRLRCFAGYAYPPSGSVGLGVQVDKLAIQRWARDGPADDARPRPPPTPLPNATLAARM